MFYDITPDLRVFVPTEVSTDMVLVDELPVGDLGDPAVRVWKQGNQMFVTIVGDESFTLNPAAVEWLRETLNS
jgi:hypothetical protein